MKRCAKCGDTKLRDEFAKNCVKKDGLQTYCRLCHNKSKDRYELTSRAKTLRKKRRKVYNQRFEVKLRNHQYRAMRRGECSKSFLTKDQWQKIIEICEHKCIYCQQALTLTMDHFRPLSMGGTMQLDNIVPACQSCNSSKNNKLVWAGWEPPNFNWDAYIRYNRYCYGDWWGRIKESELARQLC